MCVCARVCVCACVLMNNQCVLLRVGSCLVMFLKVRLRLELLKLERKTKMIQFKVL